MKITDKDRVKALIWLIGVWAERDPTIRATLQALAAEAKGPSGGAACRAVQPPPKRLSPGHRGKPDKPPGGPFPPRRRLIGPAGVGARLAVRGKPVGLPSPSRINKPVTTGQRVVCPSCQTSFEVERTHVEPND